MLRVALYQAIEKRTWPNDAFTRLFKINKVIFYLTYQKFHWQEFQEFQELLMPEFQYQSNAKSRIKFIKTRVIFR